jgi:hypothetical protein
LNYSQVSISNLALGRIGARNQITDINENSPNAVKVLAVWDAIFQEVLSERDWKFAKTRQQLQLSPVTPLYTWRFAWALPSDFLRFVRPRRRQIDRNWYWGWGPEGTGWYNRQDPPFWPSDHDYKVETLTAGWDTSVIPPIPYGTGTTPPTPFPTGKYALTNYGGWRNPAAITYIQLITDYTQLMPGFVNCLAYRMAQELAIPVTESQTKFDSMGERYKESLNSAEAQNETMDYEHDEDGSSSWECAGRRADVW